MDERMHNEIETILDREKIECRNEFMSQKSFYRSVLVGGVTFLGLAAGSFVWAVNISNDTSSLKSEVKTNKERIIRVEKAQTDYHKEQMNILNDIKEKVSR